VGAANLWQRNGDIPASDPLGKHCFDVSVNLDDQKALEWLSGANRASSATVANCLLANAPLNGVVCVAGNAYLYTKWKDGLCDNSVYPVVESSTHPGVSANVTLRKLGHGKPPAAMEAAILSGSTADCRNDTTSTPISIQIDNGAGTVAKVRGCQNQFGCKPYRDCVLAMKVGLIASICFRKCPFGAINLINP
jgi:hypothetical protein